MLDACLTKIKFTLYCGYDDIPKIKTVGYLQLSVLSTITLNCNTLFLILYILRRNCITDDWQEAFCCYYVENTIEESKFVFSVKRYLIWRACLLYSLMSSLSFERQLWPPVDAGKINKWMKSVNGTLWHWMKTSYDVKAWFFFCQNTAFSNIRLLYRSPKAPWLTRIKSNRQRFNWRKPLEFAVFK